MAVLLRYVNNLLLVVLYYANRRSLVRAAPEHAAHFMYFGENVVSLEVTTVYPQRGVVVFLWYLD